MTMSKVEKRKIDAKGRISLPVQREKDIFFIKKGDTFILSENIESLHRTAQQFEDIQLTNKLLALKNWFENIDEAGLGNISSEDMDRKIANSLSEKEKAFSQKDAKVLE